MVVHGYHSMHEYIRAGLTFRGARGIISARGPLTTPPPPPPPPPKPPNGNLGTEFSKIKKYSFVFHALKSFRCIKEEEEELRILKFSDPYDFFGLAFWSPLPKGTKKNFAALLLEPRVFYFGAPFWGPCLDLALCRVVWISR